MALNPGTNLNATPATQQQALPSNYIDFTANGNGWAQQYLPDLVEKESEVFGNRTVAGFLEKVGAEEAMASDQVIWSEQGRLHLSYQCNTTATANQISIAKSIDGVAQTTTHGIRLGDTVVVADASATAKCYVSAIDGTNREKITVLPYGSASLAAAGIAASQTGEACTIFVYGSEFVKGSDGRADANEPGFKSYTNKPIIMKDFYQVSGSDASQIGWVEVSGEEGQNGYLWYLKASGDTRSRFTDYCEMSMIEAEKIDGGTALATHNANIKGTEGLFAAVEDRGNISFNDLSLGEFDTILKEFDKQGAIEEYMMFLNRTSALAVDDMLAGMGNVVNQGAGSSYGVFDNDADMALNLGFSGFRRGSYDFYKTDWKYLNDISTRGGMADLGTGTASSSIGAVKGMFVPAGVSTVYDQSLGKNLKRPFLHVRYRASGAENRKFKTWTTGSVGASTSAIDAMEMHYLTERCLIVQGANNFVMMKG